MELEEMKNIWENQSQKLDFKLHTLSDVRSLELNNKTKIFQVSEVAGFIIAYLLAGMILFNFKEFDHLLLLNHQEHDSQSLCNLFNTSHCS